MRLPRLLLCPCSAFHRHSHLPPGGSCLHPQPLHLCRRQTGLKLLDFRRPCCTKLGGGHGACGGWCSRSAGEWNLYAFLQRGCWRQQCPRIPMIRISYMEQSVSQSYVLLSLSSQFARCVVSTSQAPKDDTGKMDYSMRKPDWPAGAHELPADTTEAVQHGYLHPADPPPLRWAAGGPTLHAAPHSPPPTSQGPPSPGTDHLQPADAGCHAWVCWSHMPPLGSDTRC